MKDIIYVFVRVELTTALPTIEDTIVEIQQDAICLITNTANVDILTSKIIAYQHNSKSNGTQS